jgi:hypothetical protein
VGTPDVRLPVAAPAPTIGAASYVLPLRSEHVATELDDYLHDLSSMLEVLVVDGSAPAVFAEHHRRWPWVRHVAPDQRWESLCRKVTGVLTGLELASHDAVIIADDDVRWSASLLERALQRLDGAQVVRPQNSFHPAPWHARWDTGRILLARALGGDWPGTLVVDRRVLATTGGYDGSVLFENLELVRTIEAAGGRAEVALDIIVPRLPPSTAAFFGQRIRQAYDELARPTYLAAELAVLPLVALGRRRALLALVSGAVLLAEGGRRRAGGRRAFPPTAALWAPAWVAERAVTSWIALWLRVRGGGARWGDVRVTRAATAKQLLVRRHADGPTSRPEPGHGPSRSG